MDAFGDGGGVSVSGIAVGSEVFSGIAVGGAKVGKAGSGVGVEGSGVPNAVHASKMGNTNKIEYRFIYLIYIR